MDRLRAGAPSCGHCGVDLVRQPELHFSGNFWWARADRIASLPEPNEFADIRRFPNALRSWRHNQEFWVTWREIASRPVCVWQSGIDVYNKGNSYPGPGRLKIRCIDTLLLFRSSGWAS